jgi:hypothetical protein
MSYQTKRVGGSGCLVFLAALPVGLLLEAVTNHGWLTRSLDINQNGVRGLLVL